MTENDKTFEKEKSLFLRSLEIPDDDRARFLKEQCADDTGLLIQVQKLLRNDATDTSLLDDLSFGTAIREEMTVGRTIDGYQLNSKLGEGGMGEVWAAVQQEPVSRHVAIKLIKSGLQTPDILRRFQAERQAVAAMDHPNIARILDAGSTADGVPYFVMELIDGIPLIQFCDDERLSIDDRLGIFVSIANAVQHAHQKAIIHRDLKPSNILVGWVDGRPTPKIIDFGLAKAVSNELGEESVQTQIGTVIGTLAYMAPEQARLNGQDVDTRTDVYSLGVILYELLTGVRPFETRQLENVDVEKRFQMIRDDEPTRPSSRLSTIESAPELARCRRSNQATLIQKLRGELDWIVLKALEKDRSRRYQSAGEFADDVLRYVNQEPIEAHPPSNFYRARKFLVRNRVLVSAISAVALAMCIGLIGTTYGMVKAQTAEAIADREQKAAEFARDVAKDEASKAKRQSAYAQAIADFMQYDLFPLTTVDGQLLEGLRADELGHDATLGQLLDRATSLLVKRNDIDLKAKADLLRVLGISYRLNQKHDEAIGLIRQACEIREEHFLNEPRELLSCFNSLAVALGENMQRQEAIVIANKALELVSGSLPIHDEVLLNARRQLAEQLAIQGEGTEARKIIDDVLVLAVEFHGNNSDPHLQSLVSSGMINSYSGQKELAIETLAMAVERMESQLGLEHPETSRVLTCYGNALYSTDRIDESAQVFRKLVRIKNNKFGHAGIASMQPMNNIGASYWKNKQLDKSIPIFEDLVKMSESHFGRRHPKTLFQLANLAINYRDDNRIFKAQELFDEILSQEHCPEFVPAEYRKMLVANKNKVRFRDVAELEIKRARVKFQNKETGLANLMARIGNDARNLGLVEYAIEIFREVLEIQQELQPKHWHTAATCQLLGTTLMEKERYDEAKVLLEKAIEVFLEQSNNVASYEMRMRGAILKLIAIAELTDDEEAEKNWRARLKSLDN